MEVIVDGKTYVFDSSGDDKGNTCLNCATECNTQKGRELCHKLPECKGGVWREKKGGQGAV